MKNLTEKQLLKLEDQIAALSFKLSKACDQHKISDRYMELCDGSFDDWDSESQESMVHALHQVDHALDRVSCLIQTVRENQGA
jgi:hypothetical protein